MKFLLLKSIKQDKMMKPILSGLLFFVILYIFSDVLVHYYGFGILLEDVTYTLLGNEEEFLDPISTSSFLEHWHIQIFFIMMLVFTLSAIFIRLCSTSKVNLFVLNIFLFSSLLSIIFLALSYFTLSLFISFYIFFFFLWHILALYMSLYSLWSLYNDKSI